MNPIYTVEVDDRDVLLHFDTFPEALRMRLRTKITTLTNALLGQVRAAEPSRTGYLRSETRAYFNEGATFVRGSVRIAATGSARRVGAAFGALEYGAPGRRGRFEVRSYRRGTFTVSAYHRTARLRALRFLRGPAAAMFPRARAEIEAVVAETLAEGNTP